MKKDWIKKAIKKPGALRKTLKAKEGEPIDKDKLKKATESDNPKTAARARFALLLAKMRAKKGKKK